MPYNRIYDGEIKSAISISENHKTYSDLKTQVSDDLDLLIFIPFIVQQNRQYSLIMYSNFIRLCTKEVLQTTRSSPVRVRTKPAPFSQSVFKAFLKNRVPLHKVYQDA